MLACATRWPCARANSGPMRVRSKPIALPYGRSISRFEPVPQPQSRIRARGHAGRGARQRRLHVLAETAKPEVRLLGAIGQFE